MNWLDIVIIVILFFFLFKGFRAGFVGAIGGFIGIILAIWLGGHFMSQVAGWLINAFNIENEAMANIAAFIIIFIAVNIATSIVVAIINKLFNIIPFINLANKLGGAVIGLIGGILGVAALVYLLSLFSFSDVITKAMDGSQFADWALAIAILVKPFIPEAIKSVKEII